MGKRKGNNLIMKDGGMKKFMKWNREIMNEYGGFKML
jgi:queuine/archaeosine tRNA-ribosyltransferase